MNRTMIIYILGCILKTEGVLMALPCLVALIYHESQGIAYVIVAVLSLIAGMLLTIRKPKDYIIYLKEGCIATSLSWILMGIVGSFPFMITGEIPSFIDALFETVSGFTTTGASILSDVESLSHCSIIWRSFTHWIGGMGVLVFIIAIVPLSGGSNINLMRAESPGPSVGKLVPKVRHTARILYIIYFGLTLLEFIILVMAKMPVFDAVNTSFATAGTGGFTVYNDGIAHYNSPLITYLVSFGVLTFGVNFNLYYFFLIRKFKAFFADEELKGYLTIVGVSTLLITFNIIHIFHGNIADSLEMSFFQVSNTITTTGFGFGNTVDWPLFSQFIILLLMCIGGSAGSTAGGFKVIRCMILARIAKNQILSTLSPNRVLTLHVNGNVLDKDTQHKVLKYMVVYMMIIAALIFIVSFDNNNFMTVVSGVLSCFNNIGPMIGTTESFSIFSPLSKFLLSLAMIAGRLEIYPMLLLFLPKTWSRR